MFSTVPALGFALALFASDAAAQIRPRRPDAGTAPPPVEQQLRVLEDEWNSAHLRGDTAALFRLWADDIAVTVPEMSPMRKAELMAFWRTGQPRIRRHETSGLTIRHWGDAAVVDGILNRQRDFTGRLVSDSWRFTKVYVRRNGEWRVVSYHASPAPQAAPRPAR